MRGLLPDSRAGQRVPLAYGVSLVLCSQHRDPRFIASRSGRDFLAAIGELYSGLGLTARRYGDALRRFVQQCTNPKRPKRHRPGSYAHAKRRQDAEGVWAAGGSFEAGLAAALANPPPELYGVRLPDTRTVRRWWQNDAGSAHPSPDDPQPPWKPPDAGGLRPQPSAGRERGRSRRRRRPPARGREPELSQDAVHVGLHGGLAEDQRDGDLGVRRPRAISAQHLPLPRASAPPARRAVTAAGGARSAKRSISRCVIAGASSASPRGDGADRVDSCSRARP